MRIASLVVSYNSGSYLEECLDSIYKACELAGIETHIFLADNHPLAYDKFAKTFSGINYLKLKNVGFGRANNQLIRKFELLESFDWFVFVNPDAKLHTNFFVNFLELISQDSMPKSNPIAPLVTFDRKRLVAELADKSRNSLSELPEFAAHDSYGRLTEKKGKKLIKFLSAENQGIQFEYLGLDFSEKEIINNAGSYAMSPWRCGDLNYQSILGVSAGNLFPYKTLFSGACVVIPKNYLKVFGGFDERFFLYYEDTDLAVRGSNKGFDAIFSENLVVSHVHSHSTKENSKQWKKSVLFSSTLFSLKHYGYAITISYLAKELREFKFTRNGFSVLARIYYRLCAFASFYTRNANESL